ncbi:Asp-tRNA(Asn)/Glu-tRNA(Gln) amidotransferase subunit GatC [Haliangium ochraceum]|uniref:Aspartyl/glutamyl-tRNA(Asn/Gln) amidotransferase subunit C n=1 Tax=Haliangium ochraceum (strain DSM 14365 / JCM 11303 / SMP-2) TaxID=502025 RepID=D0LUA9_HALO1|nr:Asp-tRNA(Asn)/Glu-tRNA(Gln) amidotransferase subunit GatC [Haliangium ochraceum]ACY19232.1 glutamyl-tRNA(Gln) amidotransferase, C subunit [Haliangium ochraceum DSM 14365]
MAAELSRNEVDEIALLARLALSDEESERLRGELGAILAHMDALQEVDTEGVAPMTHVVPMHLRLRDDQVEASLPVEEAVGAAPDSKDDYFQVPHIIDSAAGE